MRKMQEFRKIKKEIRILAWDDGPFEFKSKGKDILVGAIFRGGQFLDGLLKTEVDIDGTDATEKIIDKILKTKHKDLRVIMLDGITFAGFNTVDIKEIYNKTKLPVIVVNRKKPDFEKFISSLKKLPEPEKRLKAVESAGTIYWAKVKNKRVCFQCCGIKIEDARQIIKETSTMSLIPEPLRVAHLIATGIVLGESVGGA
jgi:endonuclease V-like protein UPF0215 family